MNRFPLWCCWRDGRTFFWFRVYGYGLIMKKVAKHPLLFSELALGRGVKLLGWHFRILTPRGT